MLFSYVGPVLRFALSEWLVLALAAPLIALVHAIWIGFSEGEAAPKVIATRLRRVGLGAFGVAAAVVIWQALPLDEARWVVQDVLRLVRIGQLDVALELFLDFAGAAMALIALGAGAASLHVQKSLSARTAVIVHLATSGAVLAVLADDAIASMIGIGMVAACGVMASGRLLGAGRLADVLLVLGAAAVFWSFGGRRAEGRYVIDLSPRIVAVASERAEEPEPEPIKVDASGKTESQPRPPRVTGKPAYLTVDALPGSWVFIDDSPTPFGTKSTPLRTPFVRAPLPAGVHAVRIHPGQGLDDYLVSQVYFDAQQEILLAPLGPTLVYRSAAAQASYEPPKGATSHRDRTMLAFGLAMLALAAIARVREIGASAPPVALAASVLCGVVFARFAPLVSLATGGAWILGAIGAITAAVFSLSATRAPTRHGVCVDLATAAVGTSVAASAVGSASAALAALALGASGVASILLATRERTASLVASAMLSGAPLPLIGAPWILSGTYGPAFLGGPMLAVTMLALGATAAWATSFAVWRVHAAALDIEKKRTDRVLVAFAAVSGLVASAVAHAIPTGAPAIGATLVLVGAAFAGRLSAVRRFADKKADLRSLDAFASARRASAQAVDALGRMASALDTHVVRFASSAAGALTFAGGWLAVRVEEHSAATFPGERLSNAASRARPTARRVAIFVAVALAVLLGASFARASGRVAIHTEDGRRGPVELSDQGGVWRGRFVVENTGSLPLSVSRIALREDDAVRAARGLSVKLEGGGTSASIPPQTSKRIEIEWKPDAEMGPQQVQAHVVLTTSDEEAGEVAMGVHAQLSGPLGPFEGRLLSLLVGLPLLGALAALVIALVFPQGNARVMRIAALASTLGQLALAIVVLRRFVPDFGRESGNDGLQLVERASWIRPLGIEWYVGVDGHAVMLVCLVALLGALGIACSREPREGHSGTFLLAISAATGASVARDLVLFVVFTGVCVVASAILTGAFGSKPDSARRAAGTMAAFGIVSLVCIVLSILALRSGSTRAFLADGSVVQHTFAMPELERVAFTRRAGSIAGIPLVELAFVLGLGGFGILAGMFPMHAWMPDAAASAPVPSSFLTAVIVPRLGMIGLVRVLAGILPEATRWAGAALVGLGAITALHAGACLVAESDLAKAAARIGMLHAGIVLVGIGSATPQGLAAASTIVFAGGIATALVLVVASALEARSVTRDALELGGLVHEAPRLATAGILGLLGAVAVPGTAAFWAVLLAVLGAAPVQPALAVLAAAGVALGGAGAFRLLSKAFFGTVPEHWRKSAALEPFGGKFPDLRTNEAWAAGALAVLVVLLGVWPAPMLDLLAGVVRDAVARANLGPLQLGF